ncbi:GUN4 domain-containing protein [Rippkaea orientalis]
MIAKDTLPKFLLVLVFSWLSLSPVKSQTTPNPSNLISPETGIDYTLLNNLLSRQQWREANNTTFRLMLQSLKREQQGWVSSEDIAQLPCSDLKIIDDLWKQHSQGRFGYTVQFPIFVATGNKPGKLVNPQFYDDFGTNVGWRKDNQWIIFRENLIYSLDAPVGHLPNPRPEYQITGGRLNYTALTERMVKCSLVSYTIDKKPVYQPAGGAKPVEQRPVNLDNIR